MTGFGKAEHNIKNANFTIEVKSLNSKHIDVNVKMPSVYRDKEIDLRLLEFFGFFNRSVDKVEIPKQTIAKK